MSRSSAARCGAGPSGSFAAILVDSSLSIPLAGRAGLKREGVEPSVRGNKKPAIGGNQGLEVLGAGQAVPRRGEKFARVTPEGGEPTRARSGDGEYDWIQRPSVVVTIGEPWMLATEPHHAVVIAGAGSAWILRTRSPFPGFWRTNGAIVLQRDKDAVGGGPNGGRRVVFSPLTCSRASWPPKPPRLSRSRR